MNRLRRSLLERALRNAGPEQLEENSVISLTRDSLKGISQTSSSMNTLQLMLKERVKSVSGSDKKDLMRAVMAIDRIRKNIDEILDDSKDVLKAAKAVNWD